LGTKIGHRRNARIAGDQKNPIPLSLHPFTNRANASSSGVQEIGVVGSRFAIALSRSAAIVMGGQEIGVGFLSDLNFVKIVC
jgi:hypothetical protein